MDFGASAGCKVSASVVLAAAAAAISGARSAAAAWFLGATPNSAWYPIRLGSWTSVSLRVTPVHGGVTRVSRRREYEVVIFKERKKSGNSVKAKKRTLRTTILIKQPLLYFSSSEVCCIDVSVLCFAVLYT